MTLAKRMEKNQTLEKFGLASAALLLVPAGIQVTINGNTNAGLGLVFLGIVALLARELIKLRK